MMDYLENPSSIKSENPSDSYYSTSTYSSINQCYFRLMSGSNDFSEGYDFKETDKFSLSIAGEDRKYELERENFILEITTGRNKSITCSRLPSCQQYILLPTSCISYITDERIISNSKPHQEYFPCTNLYSGTFVKTKIDEFLNVSGSRHCSIEQQCREVALCWRDVPDG